LPQLWNVLKGEMSLVGPRPIVDAEIIKYGKCYNIYKAVHPGITGLWQVSGRNNTTYEERLHFDRFYVRNWSPWLDMHILARTVATLACGHGAY
jgi:lipopolysaccharide/colanic/teichoic acid biosynthesis glycosyltransferase